MDIEDVEDLLDENGEIIETSQTSHLKKHTSSSRTPKTKQVSVKNLPHLQRIYIIDSQIINKKVVIRGFLSVIIVV